LLAAATTTANLSPQLRRLFDNATWIFVSAVRNAGLLLDTHSSRTVSHPKMSFGAARIPVLAKE
jgi:hypothetical protein